MMHEPRSYRQTPEPEGPQDPTGKWPLFKARHPELARMAVGFVVLVAFASIVATLAVLAYAIGLCIDPGSNFDEAFRLGAFTLATIGIGLLACYMFGFCWSLKP